MKAAILIPTIEDRVKQFDELVAELERQKSELKNPDDVVILHVRDDQQMTIGKKRNLLMEMAIDQGATHRAYIDDDDKISPNYLALNMPGVYGNYDCNSLFGSYYLNGVYDRPFHHSLQYTHWWQDEKGYYRNPNHLNMVKIDKVRHIKFQEKSFGEDGCWSEDIHREQCLKTEYVINETFYHYYCVSKDQDYINKLNKQIQNT